MGPKGNPETSVSDHLALHNNPEDGRIQFNRGGSLRSPKNFITDTTTIIIIIYSLGFIDLTGTWSLMQHNQLRFLVYYNTVHQLQRLGSYSE
jgi:hypothetical protein